MGSEEDRTTLQPAPRVGAIVLAAGASSRMGRNKLLLKLAGESLVRRCVLRAIAGGLDPVIVVLGFDAPPVGRELEGLACETVVNERHEQGRHGSVKRGLGALPPDAGAAVIVLPDMVHVTAGMLRAVVGLHRESEAQLVVSRYGDVFAPPTLYARTLFPELLDLDDAAATREVLLHHRARAATALWPQSALADVDDAEDWERLGSP